MKEENIVCLAAIRREMQERFRFESRQKRNQAFETLYFGWRQQSRRRGRNTQFFTYAWQRGWLSKKDAEDFRIYIGLT